MLINDILQTFPHFVLIFEEEEVLMLNFTASTFVKLLILNQPN